MTIRHPKIVTVVERWRLVILSVSSFFKYVAELGDISLDIDSNLFNFLNCYINIITAGAACAGSSY